AHLPTGAEQRRAVHTTAERLAPPVDRLDDGLRRPAVAGQAGADALPQLLDRQADVQVEEVLAPGLVIPQAPQVLGPVVPSHYEQIAVQHDDGAAEAGQD